MTQDQVERNTRTPMSIGERYRTLRGWEVVLWDDGGCGGYPRLRALADHLSMQTNEKEFSNLIALRDQEGMLTLFVKYNQGNDVTPLGAAALDIWRVLDHGGELVFLADEYDLHAEWAQVVSRSTHQAQPQKVVGLPKKGQ